jgi:hypothetical protein
VLRSCSSSAVWWHGVGEQVTGRGVARLGPNMTFDDVIETYPQVRMLRPFKGQN